MAVIQLANGPIIQLPDGIVVRSLLSIDRRSQCRVRPNHPPNPTERPNRCIKPRSRRKTIAPRTGLHVHRPRAAMSIWALRSTRFLTPAHRRARRTKTSRNRDNLDRVGFAFRRIEPAKAGSHVGGIELEPASSRRIHHHVRDRGTGELRLIPRRPAVLIREAVHRHGLT